MGGKILSVEELMDLLGAIPDTDRPIYGPDHKGDGIVAVRGRENSVKLVGYHDVEGESHE